MKAYTADILCSSTFTCDMAVSTRDIAILMSKELILSSCVHVLFIYLYGTP